MIDKNNKNEEKFDAQKYYSSSGYSSSGYSSNNYSNNNYSDNSYSNSTNNYSLDDFFKNESNDEDDYDESVEKEHKGITINLDFGFINKLFGKNKKKSKNVVDEDDNVKSSIKKNTGDTKIKIVIIILLLCILGIGLYIVFFGGANVIKIS